MSQPPPFSTLRSRANPKRVEKLLGSEVYRPIAAMFTLQRLLSAGAYRKLLDMFWQVAFDGARVKVLSAGYTEVELTAALAVTKGEVAPPQ